MFRKCCLKTLALVAVIGGGVWMALAALAHTESESAQKIADPDGFWTWTDATAIGLHGQGFASQELESAYDRLPAAAKGRVSDGVWSNSKYSAGLNVRFTTTTRFRLRWTLTSENMDLLNMPATGVSGVDVYYQAEPNGSWIYDRTGTPTGKVNELEVTLRPGGGTYCVNLPLYNGVEKLEIGLPAGGALTPVKPERKPVVFYGTSITQGGCASRPGMAHTSIVSRLLNVEVINLGFSGSALCEPEMAELLARIDARAYVVDPLPNSTVAMIRERLRPFIEILVKARPGVPVIVTDFTTSATARSPAGELMEQIIGEIRQTGATNVRYVPGAGALGGDTEATVDGTHPSDLGFSRQGAFFTNALEELGIVGSQY